MSTQENSRTGVQVYSSEDAARYPFVTENYKRSKADRLAISTINVGRIGGQQQLHSYCETDQLEEVIEAIANSIGQSLDKAVRTESGLIIFKDADDADQTIEVIDWSEQTPRLQWSQREIDTVIDIEPDSDYYRAHRSVGGAQNVFTTDQNNRYPGLMPGVNDGYLFEFARYDQGIFRIVPPDVHAVATMIEKLRRQIDSTYGENSLFSNVESVKISPPPKAFEYDSDPIFRSSIPDFKPRRNLEMSNLNPKTQVGVEIKLKHERSLTAEQVKEALTQIPEIKIDSIEVNESTGTILTILSGQNTIINFVNLAITAAKFLQNKK